MAKRTNGHELLPLEKRMTKHELDRRQYKREDRATFRQQISKEHAMTRGLAVVAMNVLGRGFWGRMKWLFLGK